MATTLSSKMLSSLFDSLIADGKRVIANAATTTDLKRKIVSGNLQDAYGAAVYFDGKIVRQAFYNETPISSGVHKGWEKRGIGPNTGRGYLEKFFSSYQPKARLCLLCVNAVYYTDILEDGAQGRPHVDISTKYHIISQTMSDMANIQRKYKGSKIGRVTYRG